MSEVDPATATTAAAALADDRAMKGRRWPRWVLFGMVVVVVLVAGLEPVPMPQLFPRQDKLQHLLGFGALYFSAAVAFPRWRGMRMALACLAVALLIEIGQGLFLPYRTASLGDMLANLLGVALGAACTRLAQHLRPDTNL